MAEKRPALGRGLSALIPEAPAEAPVAAASASRAAPRGVPLEVDLDRIVPNPRQPRLQMEQGPLEELAQSIRVNGIIQPILVRRSGDRSRSSPASAGGAPRRLPASSGRR